MFKQLPSRLVKRVNIIIDEQPLQVQEGMTVAAAALSSGLVYTRTTPISGSKRAPFCMMGVCFDCLMVIDGKPNQRACSTTVYEGMRIESQRGVGSEITGTANE
jgi:predicted molibdopterin-dependent oxidoreductase YjgC